MQQIEFRAMGSAILIALDTDDTRAADALAQTPTWFAEWEARLSRFRAESELSALNRASGEPVRVSATLGQAIQTALDAARASDGLITPTLLDALQAAGYDRSFEQIGGAPVSPTRTPAVVADWRAIEWNAATHTLRVPRGVHLDLGGVAKGWAAEQAAHRLVAIAPVMVDAGGDLAITGARANGEPWPIAVLDPLQPANDLALLMIERGGVATSGRDYRRWERNGKAQHHIIDPRTGAPAETDVLSATVIAPTTPQAEVAAKVAFILGSRAGSAWLRARRYAGLLVLENGRTAHTPEFENFLWRAPNSNLVGVTQ